MKYPLGSIIEECSLQHTPRYFKILNHFYPYGAETYTLDMVWETRYRTKMVTMNNRNRGGTPRLSLADVCRLYMDATVLEDHTTKLLLKGGIQYWQNYKPGLVKVIDRFRGKYRFMSNFLEHPVGPFPHGEAAFQSCKCVKPADINLFKDPALKPAKAKSMGREVKLIPDWEKNKVGFMRDVIHEKFRDPGLRRMLLDTGDSILIEGNNHGDTFWGVCNGKGKNVLGMLLMEERALICTTNC